MATFTLFSAPNERKMSKSAQLDIMQTLPQIAWLRSGGNQAACANIRENAALVRGSHEQLPAGARGVSPWLDKERIYRKSAGASLIEMVPSST